MAEGHDTVAVTTRIKREVDERVTRLADESGISKSRIYRQLIEEAVPTVKAISGIRVERLV